MSDRAWPVMPARPSGSRNSHSDKVLFEAAVSRGASRPSRRVVFSAASVRRTASAASVE